MIGVRLRKRSLDNRMRLLRDRLNDLVDCVGGRATVSSLRPAQPRNRNKSSRASVQVPN